MLAWARGFRSRRGWAVGVAMLIGLGAVRGETVESHLAAASGGTQVEAGEAKTEHRYREGATLENALGEFREAGERIRFYLSDNKNSFVAVENLALERVSRVLDQNTSPRAWSVSGVVTEYRGGNYLIIKRASLKARGRRGAGNRPRS